MILPLVGTGAIEGGWEFVWAAYGLTWLFFSVYSASLLLRPTDPPEDP